MREMLVVSKSGRLPSAFRQRMVSLAVDARLGHWDLQLAYLLLGLRSGEFCAPSDLDSPMVSLEGTVPPPGQVGQTMMGGNHPETGLPAFVVHVVHASWKSANAA